MPPSDPSPAPGPHALILDADNTLWDTNRVFDRARAAMIRALTKNADRADGAADAEADGGVLRSLGRHLSAPEAGNYPLEQLARAAAFYMFGADHGRHDAPDPVAPASRPARAEWAARQVRSDRRPAGIGPSCAREAAEAFRSALSAVPPLLDGTRVLLDAVQGWRDDRPNRRTSILFSEGDPDRLGVAFGAYGIGNGRYFDDIVLREKTPDAFREVREAAGAAVDRPGPRAAGVVVVGDSLRRDIQPANAVGCTTVYCPGDFKGRETPEGPAERPDYTVDTPDEVMGVFGL